MKNSDIHNGLDRKEIRDFLAMSIVKGFEEQTKEEKRSTLIYDKNNPFDYAIKSAERQLCIAKDSLEEAKTRFAISQMLKLCGWSEHDVSDETIKDSGYKLHMSFIGTDEEHEALLKKIEVESE